MVEEVPAATLTERIHVMLERADGAIALNGSIGTLTELLIAWNVAFVAQFSDETAKPVIAVGIGGGESSPTCPTTWPPTAPWSPALPMWTRPSPR